MFVAGADQPDDPVEQRVAVGPLGVDVHPIVAELADLDHGADEFFGVGRRDTGVGGVAPVDRRPDGVALRKREVVTHPDLVAGDENRRPGQREEEAVGHGGAVAVAREHRAQPALPVRGPGA
jgi:hypothetical protein